MTPEERQAYYDSLGIKFNECIDHGKPAHKTANYAGYRVEWCPVLKISTSLHRLVYLRAHGLTPKDIKGLVIMHLCDNPRCINPDHLKAGTHRDNMKDASMKGRARNWRVLKDPLKYLYLDTE